MTALFPAMLAGLTALAIPVVLHLIARHRFPVRDLPTTQFLNAHQRNNVLAARLIDVPQLILRLLLLATIVLAMSRLFGGSTPDASPRNLVLVIDASSSMKMKVEGPNGRTIFDAALATAKQATAALPRGSRCGLISDGLAGPIEMSPHVDVAAVEARAATLRPIDGGGRSLAENVARACEMVRGRREIKSQVLVLTDLRASAFALGNETWRQRIDAIKEEMGSRLEVVLIDLAKGQEQNVGVVAAQLRGGEARVGDDAHVVARVHNSGDKAIEPSIKLTVGGRPESAPRKIAIEPGAEAVVDLPLRVNRAASALARVEVETDRYDADDAASAPVAVVDARRVLLITPGDAGVNVGPEGTGLAPRSAGEFSASMANLASAGSSGGNSGGTTTKPSAAEQDAPGLDGAAILRFALNPGRELGTGQSSGIEVTQVAVEAVGSQPLSKYDLIVLYGAARLSAQAIADIRTLVEQGRSLVVFCPETMAAMELNRYLAERSGGPAIGGAGGTATTLSASSGATSGGRALMPMRVGNVKVMEQAAGMRLSDTAHPLFAPFRDPLRGDLSSLQFQRVREIPAVPPEAHVLAQTTRGEPLIIQTELGRGRVVVMTFGVELSAGNLARSRVFPVLMWRLVDYLSGRLDPAPQAALTAMRPAMVEMSEPALRLAGDLELAPLRSTAASQPATQSAKGGTAGEPPMAPISIKVDANGNAMLPPLPAGDYVLRRPTLSGPGGTSSNTPVSTSGGGGTSGGRMVSVLSDPAESRMHRADETLIGSSLGAPVRIIDAAQLATLSPDGSEWTGWLVIGAVILYLIEATTSWISSARRERQRVTEAAA